MSDDLLYNTQAPVTFISWLESRSFISKDYAQNLKDYQAYIKEWHEKRKSSQEVIKDSFIELYVDLLNEISLTYATGEEKRFISNCDFTNSEELDIILPFFVQKLKTICLYYYQKRENLKKKIGEIPFKGIKNTAENVVRELILDEVESENLQLFTETKFTIPSLSAINENLLIKIEELYDDAGYGNTPTKISQLDIDPLIFLDFKQAIVEAVQKYPVLIEGIKSNFSLNVSLSGNQLGYLKPKDFKDYFLSNNIDDLKLQLYRQFATKFMGCDMYYVSTGNTFTDLISGKLFDTRPLSGSVTLSPYNRVYPGIATVPSLSSLAACYYCGKFFIPSKTATLQFNTFNKTFEIDKKRLKPNTVYVFSDPNKMGNVADLEGNERQNYPLVFEIDVSFNKIPHQNNFRFGDILSTSLDHLFYPYQSESQEQY
jgi:hypothetical protein